MMPCDDTADSSINVKLTVNGRECSVYVTAQERLLDTLRERLGLHGTKEGCGAGECGACTVILDGRAVCSCLVLTAQLQGSYVLTIEGLSENGQLHPLQEAFIESGAVQCGFCTPGMIMSAKAMLDWNPEPTVGEVREALSGNLCRCTGYDKIVKAVLLAAARLRGEEVQE